MALAPRTTLELGGAARHFITAEDDATVAEALRWAGEQQLPVAILGGGSNLVVADAGFDGLVIAMAQRGVEITMRGATAQVIARAGEPWDALVAMTVERDLSGLECLSGIPGLVGATPIQNVGAYGQEVAETIASVRVLDRAAGQVHVLDNGQCGFRYRDSAFKRDPERHVVLSVTFALTLGGEPALRYAELVEALAPAGATPDLASVRETVIALRRDKSMVIDPDDENRRSAGSFFTNPIVSAEQAARVVQQALDEGLVERAAQVPQYPADGERVKLAAGWLIERAGFAKGTRRGHVGISSRHALGLVHHGGATTAELLDLAREVRDGVQRRFGVTLVPEPVLLGVTL
ncbi:MAG: UDP-N-acetylmuramate dehydrogenase [Myxococcales bacterium]|nr:UDP-N-acetylmuramate dehydrogenase [Myxococcales bacterium]